LSPLCRVPRRRSSRNVCSRALPPASLLTSRSSPSPKSPQVTGSTRVAVDYWDPPKHIKGRLCDAYVPLAFIPFTFRVFTLTNCCLPPHLHTDGAPLQEKETRAILSGLRILSRLVELLFDPNTNIQTAAVCTIMNVSVSGR